MFKNDNTAPSMNELKIRHSEWNQKITEHQKITVWISLKWTSKSIILFNKSEVNYELHEQ